MADARQERAEDEMWRKENLSKMVSALDEKKETLADIILTVYAFMIFTNVLNGNETCFVHYFYVL